MINFNANKLSEIVNNLSDSQILLMEQKIKDKKKIKKSITSKNTNLNNIKNQTSCYPLLDVQFHVIFMLGVPCAGKGTLCSMLTKSFDQLGFISAGDCLREARNDKNNQ